MHEYLHSRRPLPLNQRARHAKNGKQILGRLVIFNEPCRRDARLSLLFKR